MPLSLIYIYIYIYIKGGLKSLNHSTLYHMYITIQVAMPFITQKSWMYLLKLFQQDFLSGTTQYRF